jgi:hypothetical protein
MRINYSHEPTATALFLKLGGFTLRNPLVLKIARLKWAYECIYVTISSNNYFWNTKLKRFYQYTVYTQTFLQDLGLSTRPCLPFYKTLKKCSDFYKTLKKWSDFYKTLKISEGKKGLKNKTLKIFW